MRPENKKAKLAFFASLATSIILAAYFYGILSSRNNLIPVPQLKFAASQIKELLDPDSLLRASSNNYIPDQSITQSINFHEGGEFDGRLVMITGLQSIKPRTTFVKVIDRSGKEISNLVVNWNDIWAQQAHAGNKNGTVNSNGMYLHGIEILPDASLVANFEHLSTFRIDACGNPIWKLENWGHHSVHYSGKDYIWAAAENKLVKNPTGFQNNMAPLRSWTIQKISLDGELIDEISILDILYKNDLLGLVHMSTLQNRNTQVTGDTLHLNDIDEFPSGMKSNIFSAGDLMVSLRNINTVFVFNPETLEIKFITTGKFLRQHDPDFMPGDKISVFDNRNLFPSSGPIPLSSRIIEIDALTGDSAVSLQGKGKNVFFTSIMGVHQRLKNGNILITSSDEGRVLEYNSQGIINWSFDNVDSNNKKYRVFAAKVLPQYMDESFFKDAKKKCVSR